jgi:hypothetical protein
MKKIIFFIFGITFFLSAHAEEPFLISVKNGKIGTELFQIPYSEIRITSKADLLEVQQIVVNKGNCKMALIGTKKELPRKLKFGEEATFSFSPCKNVIQVGVKTDQGSWTLSAQ